MTDPQARLDRASDDFAAGRLDRRGYVDAVDAIYTSLPPALRGRLDRRRDARTAGRFALEIHDNTARERFLVDAWAALLVGRDLVLVDAGLANDGRVVLDPRGRSGRPDYIARSPEGDRPLEVKFGPYQGFVTYKLADLENYVGRGDVLVLTILGDRTMVGANGDPDRDAPLEVPLGLKWFLMDDGEMRTLMAVAEHGRHRGFGGKETVRLHSGDFHRVFRLREWRPVGRHAILH